MDDKLIIHAYTNNKPGKEIRSPSMISSKIKKKYGSDAKLCHQLPRSFHTCILKTKSENVKHVIKLVLKVPQGGSEAHFSAQILARSQSALVRGNVGKRPDFLFSAHIWTNRKPGIIVMKISDWITFL